MRSCLTLDETVMALSNPYLVAHFFGIKSGRAIVSTHTCCFLSESNHHGASAWPVFVSQEASRLLRLHIISTRHIKSNLPGSVTQK